MQKTLFLQKTIKLGGGRLIRRVRYDSVQESIPVPREHVSKKLKLVVSHKGSHPFGVNLFDSFWLSSIWACGNATKAGVSIDVVDPPLKDYSHLLYYISNKDYLFKIKRLDVIFSSKEQSGEIITYGKNGGFTAQLKKSLIKLNGGKKGTILSELHNFKDEITTNSFYSFNILPQSSVTFTFYL